MVLGPLSSVSSRIPQRFACLPVQATWCCLPSEAPIAATLSSLKLAGVLVNMYQR